MKNKICVYTCITGSYDNLKEISNIEKGIDYYCFTNNKKIKSNTWNVIYINDNNLTDIQLARKIKILGHPKINNKYEIYVWMDGIIFFNKSIKQFISKYLGKNDYFVAFKHNCRNSIKEECLACIESGKENISNVKKILSFYEKENYKFDNNLIESTVFIKRGNNKIIKETMKLWFYMIMNYSIRDQLSFNYCIFKTDMKVKWINENVWNNKWFSWNNHHNYKNSLDKIIITYNKDTKVDINSFYIWNLEKNNDIFKANIVTSKETNKIVFNLPHTPFIYIKKILINNKKETNITFFNEIDYNDGYAFYNENGAFEIYDKFNKDDSINIQLEMKIMNMYEIVELQNYLINLLNKKNVEINNLNLELISIKNKVDKLEKDNKNIKDEMNKILNSKRWKLFDKLNFNKKGRK